MLPITIMMNLGLLKMNSFYGDNQLHGKSNRHTPIFTVKNPKARIAKLLASPRLYSWQVRGWVPPDNNYSMPSDLA